ncbi:APC family permease [Novosphingobium tardum]|uniref:APC family permease n=1 Tax=Novosphingobium tardum TaxID=1538021 RepID=A0ABV8RM35_9SPHN
MTARPGVGQKEAQPQLVRALTLAHAVLYGIGVTIGAGIYVLVGIAAGRSGMHAPLAFLVAALALAPTAAAFAELGTRMPVSASEAAYVQRAFGRRWLTIAMGLLVIASATISAATISAGSAGYIGMFVDLPRGWIVAGVVLAMGSAAALATARSVAIAGAMTLVEVGGLVLIIAAGLVDGEPVFARLGEMIPTPGEFAAWRGIGATALVAVFAFIGFEHLVNVGEEMKEPSRTLPRALFITLGVTGLLYVLVVWIAVVAVPPAQLAASDAPLALVFQRLTGLPLVTMSAIAVVATLNGIVVHVIMIARVLYGMATLGDLPRPLARVDPRTATPHVATAVAVAMILVLALAVPLGGLADLASRGTLLVFAGIDIALLRIKLRGDPLPAGAFSCPLPVVWIALAAALTLLALELYV